MKTEILIVGGGLSGLHTAHALQRNGAEVLLVEARDRLGGRILSRRGGGPDGAAFDLGPTWFWPGQRRMESLIRVLGLERDVFDQPSAGEALYENETGAVVRGVGGVSMAGSLRVEGGMARIVTALAELIPRDTVRCRSLATGITRHGDRVHTTVRRDGDDEIIDSARVVVALPPRLAASSIVLAPALTAVQTDALRRTATWMAGQAKLVALYDEPFWLGDGLSGDAVSYHGPLGEIHDASPLHGGPAALFGFVAVPPADREGRKKELQEAAVAQLGRLFGRRAAQPREILLKDWAFDPLTATEDDHPAQAAAHPVQQPSGCADTAWDHRLLWSGSETAQLGSRNNGYLEGALEASERAVRLASGV